VTDAQSPPAAGPYHVAEIFKIGGAGGWDYVTVDPEHQRLYVPRTTHTMVLDAATGKGIGDIPGQKGCHGVALVPDLGRGFITDGKDGSVVVFDLKTFALLGKIKAEDDADGIIYDPASRKVLVSCGDAGVMVPIAADVDPKAGHADAAVSLGGKPEFLVADGQGKAFINLVDKNEVAVVDTRAMKVLDRWPTAPGGAPVGMSMDPQRRRLFVGCRKPQKLIVMSADNGKVLADLPIGAGVDATQFDNGYAFASCRDGSLAIAQETSPGNFQIVQNLKTRPGAKTMGIDPKTHAVFLPTAEFSNQTDARARPIARSETFMIVVVRPSNR
jgi:DNA-binding beta-propeller fold protein YncE